MKRIYIALIGYVMLTVVVDGGFTEWSDWSVCPVTCGGGMHERLRTCTNPPPSGGGKDCDGPKKQVQTCSDNECPASGKEYMF